MIKADLRGHLRGTGPGTTPVQDGAREHEFAGAALLSQAVGGVGSGAVRVSHLEAAFRLENDEEEQGLMEPGAGVHDSIENKKGSKGGVNEGGDFSGGGKGRGRGRGGRVGSGSGRGSGRGRGRGGGGGRESNGKGDEGQEKLSEDFVRAASTLQMHGLVQLSQSKALTSRAQRFEIV